MEFCMEFVGLVACSERELYSQSTHLGILAFSSILAHFNG
jgi:hypothetical protein